MPKNRSFLILWFLTGLLGLLTFLRFYEYTHTEASVDLKVGRKEAILAADNFIRSVEMDPDGYDKTVTFQGCDTSYMQYAVGIKRTNELIKSDIPCWSWKVQYFKELQVNGYDVDIDPASGRVTQFAQYLPDSAASEHLLQRNGRSVAEEYFALLGEDISDYKLLQNSTTRMRNRTDHSFTWWKRGYYVGEAGLWINMKIYGDKLGEYSKYLRAPEEFDRKRQQQEMSGWVLTWISFIGMAVLAIGAVFSLIKLHKHYRIRWRLALIISLLVIPVSMLSFVNNLPLLWSGYIDTMSREIYLLMTVVMALVSTAFGALIIFLFCAAGEGTSDFIGLRSFPLLNALRERRVSDVLSRTIVGYSLGFLGLGYVTVFYLFAVNLFDVWQPISPDYSNVLATGMPFLYPLTVALFAALNEEFMVRLFAISFLRKYLKVMWVAVFLSAVLWAFAHSTYPVYPMYVRGIELTILGIVWGIIYLTFGIETVIIAHYTHNAILVGLPLLTSNNSYFVTSGFIVIFLLALPAILLPLWLMKRNAAPTATEGTAKSWEKAAVIPALFVLVFMVPHALGTSWWEKLSQAKASLVRFEEDSESEQEELKELEANSFIAGNDAKVQEILKEMHEASEAYRKKHDGQAPVKMEQLMDGSEAAIVKNYCDQIVDGFTIRCEMPGGETYKYSAIPLQMGVTGSRVFDVTPSGKSEPKEADQRRQIDSDIAQLRSLVEEVYAKRGTYPDDKSGSLHTSWRIHRISTPEPLDPFDGTSYGYRLEKDQYLIFSPGQDGKMQTSDDIYFSYPLATPVADSNK